MEPTVNPVAPERREEDEQQERITDASPETENLQAEENTAPSIAAPENVEEQEDAPPDDEASSGEQVTGVDASSPGAGPEGQEQETESTTTEVVPPAASSVEAEEATVEVAPSDESEPQSEPPEHPMDALEDADFALKQFRRGQMVRGIILSKTDSEIVVDIGGKSEGIVPSQDLARLDEEFLNQLRVGDEIVAYVLTPEGREGHAVLSLSKARGEFEWERMIRLQQENATIEAQVTEANRGGVIVQVGPLRGFVPASHIVPRPETRRADSPEDRFAPLRGQMLRLKVLEVDRNRRRLILSEREAEKEEREKRRHALLEELRPGEVRQGRVSSITKFGAFVDLGGVDGLIHISELSWGRVEHPSDVVRVGDEVEVYVLDVDREKGRVSLSLRRLQPKPWDTVLERYAIGQVVEGTVTRVVPFGAFVRLDDGIEGLVHISELADRYVNHPHEVVKEGDRVQVRILNIEPERKRMGLSIKQVSEDEYVEIDWEVADEDEVEEGTWTALADVLSGGEEDEDVPEAPSVDVMAASPPQSEEAEPIAPTGEELEARQEANEGESP